MKAVISQEGQIRMSDVLTPVIEDGFVLVRLNIRRLAPERK